MRVFSSLSWPDEVAVENETEQEQRAAARFGWLAFGGAAMRAVDHQFDGSD